MADWQKPLLLIMVLTACATPATSSREEHEAPPEEVASWEEGCEAEGSLVLLCPEGGEGECGFFQCRDVMPRQEMLLAFRGGGGVLAPGPASPRRWWGGPLRWPERTEPILTFRFNSHFDPRPPQFLLPPGRYVRHHIFPQARDLAEWFNTRGVKDIHQFTLVIPEHLHRRIHGGGARGGLWNDAWRQFRDANYYATPEQIYRHAGELMYRFELVGSVVPYYKR